MYVVVFLALAVAGAIVQLARDRRPRTRGRICEVFLTWWLGLGLGGSALFAAMGHLFLANEVAESIGWPTGSPFQREVGFANLALGTIAVLSVWKRGGFREAAMISMAIFLLGAAIGHIIEIVDTGNTAESNAGPILYTDIFAPLVSIGLLIGARREERAQPSDTVVIENAWQ